MLIDGQNLTGLKITEMVDSNGLNTEDLVPIVQNDFNKKTTIEDFIGIIDVPKLTSDLQNTSTVIAASANATNALYTRIQEIKTQIDSLVLELDTMSDNISTIEDEIDSGDLTVKWDNILDRPSDDDLIGPQGEKGEKGDKGDTGATGPQGPAGTAGADGADGADGTNGTNGTSSYFHVRWSVNSDGNPMTTTPSDYIGTYVGTSSTAPTNYQLYTWQLVKGAQGEDGTQGIPGTNGDDGQTSYLHIKYGTGYVNGVMQFTTNQGEDPGDWLGQYVDFEINDSTDPASYTWSYIKGEEGEAGEDGIDGSAGPITMYMGEYSDTETYIGNSSIRHIVKWTVSGTTKYYMVLQTAGEITGIAPNNTLYWEEFYGQFKNIATEFIFAEGANIGGWIFNTDADGNQILQSQNGSSILNGTTGNITGKGTFSTNSTDIITGTTSSGSFNNNSFVLANTNSTGTKDAVILNTALHGIDQPGSSAGQTAAGGTLTLNTTGISTNNNYCYASGVEFVGRSTNSSNTVINGIRINWSSVNNLGGLAIVLSNLPTSAPSISGCLWNDGGTIKITS